MRLIRPLGVAALLATSTAAYAQDAAPTPPPAAPAPAATPEVPAPTAEAPAAAPAPADAAVLAAIAALDPSIGDVQIVGPWTEGERTGVWRTIMTQSAGETTGSRFFVQQLEQSAAGTSVASSIEVTEIAGIDGAIVGYRADAPAEGAESSLTIFFDIVPSDGEISQTYELFVAPGAPYRFGPATN